MAATPSQSRLENYRRELPNAARFVAQVVVDNPGQVALFMAGSIVIGKIMINAVRPRTVIEALATVAVADAVCILLTKKLINDRVLQFRIRDTDGALVPLELPGNA